MRTFGFSRCGIEPLHVAPPREPCEDRKRASPQTWAPRPRLASHVMTLHAKRSRRARNPITSTHSPCWMATAKAPGSSSKQDHQAHAHAVRVVDPCAPGALHPKRVGESNRERRYLAFSEIIGQARLSKRLAIRRFGRKLAQTQIRTNGRGIVAARFREQIERGKRRSTIRGVVKRRGEQVRRRKPFILVRRPRVLLIHLSPNGIDLIDRQIGLAIDARLRFVYGKPLAYRN